MLVWLLQLMWFVSISNIFLSKDNLIFLKTDIWWPLATSELLRGGDFIVGCVGGSRETIDAYCWRLTTYPFCVGLLYGLHLPVLLRLSWDCVVTTYVLVWPWSFYINPRERNCVEFIDDLGTSTIRLLHCKKLASAFFSLTCDLLCLRWWEIVLYYFESHWKHI